LISELDQPALRYTDTYEESSANGVNPRAHWKPLIDSLQKLGSEELGRRWAQAERRIRDNGITYNIYGDPEGENRPWRTDIVPLMISGEEWRYLKAGITQRAELLSRVLEDLYGPQNLIKEGHFPAALLYGNPAFLRPMVGVSEPATCTCSPSTSRGLLTASGGSSPIAPKRPPAAGTRWKIAPSSQTCCPNSFAPRTWSVSRRSSVHSVKP
jgi:uncharacterized circularly permuted ATP-grasp superfamily protein